MNAQTVLFAVLGAAAFFLPLAKGDCGDDSTCLSICQTQNLANNGSCQPNPNIPANTDPSTLAASDKYCQCVGCPERSLQGHLTFKVPCTLELTCQASCSSPIPLNLTSETTNFFGHQCVPSLGAPPMCVCFCLNLNTNAMVNATLTCPIQQILNMVTAPINAIPNFLRG